MADEERLAALAALPWTWRIERDQDTAVWIVTVEEMPDFFAAGDTPGEAAYNAREAFLSHLAGYIATGTEIPFPAARSSNLPMTASYPEEALASS